MVIGYMVLFLQLPSILANILESSFYQNRERRIPSTSSSYQWCAALMLLGHEWPLFLVLHAHARNAFAWLLRYLPTLTLCSCRFFPTRLFPTREPVDLPLPPAQSSKKNWPRSVVERCSPPPARLSSSPLQWERIVRTDTPSRTPAGSSQRWAIDTRPGPRRRRTK